MLRSVAGQCITPCSDASPCANGTVCVNSQCQSACSPSNPTGACVSGQVCTSAGACAPCSSALPCASSQTCIDGQCASTCSASNTDGACANNAVCSSAGACVPCSATVPCASNETCVQGQCGTVCSAMGTCASGLVCAQPLNFCVLPCSTSVPDGFCMSMVHVRRECTHCVYARARMSGANGQTCSSGACVPCSAANACTGGLLCVDGVCETPCSPASLGGACANALTCAANGTNAGMCVLCSATNACAMNETCFDSRCGVACGATTPCNNNALCVNGLCAAACSPNVPDGACVDGQVCASGACAPCSASVLCPSGLTCVSGVCGVACSAATPCANGVCVSGVCGAACSSSTPDGVCANGLVCVSGACGNCTMSSQCLFSGQTCKPSLLSVLLLTRACVCRHNWLVRHSLLGQHDVCAVESDLRGVDLLGRVHSRQSHREHAESHTRACINDVRGVGCVCQRRRVREQCVRHRQRRPIVQRDTGVRQQHAGVRGIELRRTVLVGIAEWRVRGKRADVHQRRVRCCRCDDVDRTHVRQRNRVSDERRHVGARILQQLRASAVQRAVLLAHRADRRRSVCVLSPVHIVLRVLRRWQRSRRRSKERQRE
jgi:hypothetical protein